MKRKYSGGMFSAGKRAAIIVPNNFPRIAVATVQRRQSVPVARAGMYRKSGFYGRFGKQAKDNGNRPELKYFDTAVNFSFDTTGEIPATGQLALIPQGDTATTRDGRQATIKSIQIRGDLNFVPAANAVAAGSTHLYLVQDRQCNGALAGIDDVFRNVGTPISMRFRNLANSQRFRILKRCEYVLKNSYEVTGVAFGGLYARDSGFINLNVPFEFSGSTGSISEIKTNNLFMLISTDSTTDLVSYELTSRLKFTDL